jgi:hypothetical protein
VRKLENAGNNENGTDFNAGKDFEFDGEKYLAKK